MRALTFLHRGGGGSPPPPPPPRASDISTSQNWESTTTRARVHTYMHTPKQTLYYYYYYYYCYHYYYCYIAVYFFSVFTRFSERTKKNRKRGDRRLPRTSLALATAKTTPVPNDFARCYGHIRSFGPRIFRTRPRSMSDVARSC